MRDWNDLLALMASKLSLEVSKFSLLMSLAILQLRELRASIGHQLRTAPMLEYAIVVVVHRAKEKAKEKRSPSAKGDRAIATTRRRST